MTTTLTSLHRGRDAVMPALRATLARLDPTSRAQAEYHFGWSDVDGRPASGRGGKAVRPTLALLSAEAVGAPARTGLPGAVAVELVHNFSLLHDDLMDGDVERHHRRTVWAVWGPSGAILTGDALLSLAHETLLDCGSPHAAEAGRLLSTATRELIRGQVQDLAFERRGDVTLSECLDMAAGKTGALLSASAAIGAVLAGTGPGVVDALSTFGSHLGIAFQLIDDVLGIWGDPAATGKPVHSDLRARKKSLPVTYVLTRGRGAGTALGQWLARPGPYGDSRSSREDQQPDEASLAAAADLVAAGGGRDWAVAEAARRMDLAASALDSVALASGPRHELLALGHFIVNREA